MSSSAPASSSLPLTAPVLVERERELQQLAGLVRDALGGDGRHALIEGPAGIGKSRLLQEARRRAADHGALVLSGRGGELERDFPFGVVRQLFEGVLVDPELRDVAYAGAAAPARAVLGALDEPGEGGDASFAALHGLYWLTLNLAGVRPIVLAIDDLQWADRPTLRFVAYLVRRLEGLPILVVTTLRTGGSDVDEALLGEIAHDPSTHAVRPAPLTIEAVRALIAERLGADPDRDFCAACHAATGGNPLLLRELLTALAADGVQPDAARAGVVRDIGPRAVSRTVLVRLARLPPEAVAVARGVAVLGDSADLAAVAALTELSGPAVAEATAALARADILAPEAPLGFVHPLVRDAVYRDLAPAQRELLHAAAAAALRDAGAPVEQVAAQLLAAPRRGEAWAGDALRDAGRLAVARGAAENAVAFLRRAIEEPVDPEQYGHLLLELGLAEGLTDGPAAVEHLHGAYDALRDPGMRAFTANILARLELHVVSASAGSAFAREAAAALEPGSDERMQLESVELIAGFWDAIPIAELERLHPYRDAETARRGGAGAKMLAGLAAWDWTTSVGPADAVCELALATLTGGVLVESDEGLVAMAPFLVLSVADHPRALTEWDDFLARAHRRGSIYSIASIHLWRGFTLLRRGDLADAEEHLTQAREDFDTWGFNEYAQIYTAGFLAQCILRRGDLVAARKALEVGYDPGADADGAAWWRGAELELLVAEGRDAEAVAAGYAYGERFTRLANPTVVAWRSLTSLSLTRLGRREEAEGLARDELELARRFGAPSQLSRSLRSLAAAVGDEQGLPHLEEAVAVVDGSTARREAARALADLGSALRRLRRPAEARDPLRRALELADATGAGVLADHVRTELHASGVRPRTSALSGVESLTASERRVAALAAEGGSNRDIAQTLFVTPKTVEVHLSNAYRKLGVRSRRELAGALGA